MQNDVVLKDLELDKSEFEFVQKDTFIKDEKIETKKIGFFKDALIRFSKNRASVVAFCIILILVLFSIFAPIIAADNYNGTNYDSNRLYYTRLSPKNSWFSDAGFWDGKYERQVNQNEYNSLYAMGYELSQTQGENDKAKSPIIGLEEILTVNNSPYYVINYDNYYGLGFRYIAVTVAQYEAIQEWQNANGIQVIYPAVDFNSSLSATIANNANIWYEVTNNGNPVVTYENGDRTKPVFTSRYSTTANDGGYHSLRIAGDDGSYRYARPTGASDSTGSATAYSIRVDLYNYYQYLYGKEPSFLFGTDSLGYDIFTRLARAGRFSFILAIFVSVINLLIGSIYGAVEGYFGGAIDLVMERICDILGNIPFMVVTTLFQLHLANKVGVVPSLLFAFILTGWIGTASTVRMQFYRYKNQEYVLAARTLGASNKRLMFKHIFPNAIGTIITSSVLVIPSVIFSESSLTYLGIVNLDSSSTTSVGTMLANGRSSLQTYPHIILFPALFISLLMITFNLFGNGLRDAFNPSLRGSED